MDLWAMEPSAWRFAVIMKDVDMQSMHRIKVYRKQCALEISMRKSEQHQTVDLSRRDMENII